MTGSLDFELTLGGGSIVVETVELPPSVFKEVVGLMLMHEARSARLVQAYLPAEFTIVADPDPRCTVALAPRFAIGAAPPERRPGGLLWAAVASLGMWAVILSGLLWALS